MSWLVPAAGVIALAAMGCAGAAPPRELVSARNAYEHARASEARRFAVDDLAAAQETLARAEDSYRTRGDAQETRELAHVAERRALRAERLGTHAAQAEVARRGAPARTAPAVGTVPAEQAFTERGARRDDGRLDSSSERNARVLAERKTESALTNVEGAEVRESARGTVMVLPTDFFTPGAKDALAPSADARLDAIARALATDARNVVIVCRASGAESSASGRALGMQRAESVRMALIARGVPRERVRVETPGSANPSAAPKKAASRAVDRRVEIILERTAEAEKTSSPMGLQGPTGASDMKR